jgi:hypothetical protein
VVRHFRHQRVQYEKFGNNCVKILKFWRTELSYAQDKNRGKKMPLLGMDTCPRLNDIISNFLFANSFSIKFLYFFIISSLFPYFNLFVSIFIQSYVNRKTRLVVPTTNIDIFDAIKSSKLPRKSYVYFLLRYELINN